MLAQHYPPVTRNPEAQVQPSVAIPAEATFAIEASPVERPRTRPREANIIAGAAASTSYILPTSSPPLRLSLLRKQRAAPQWQLVVVEVAAIHRPGGIIRINCLVPQARTKAGALQTPTRASAGSLRSPPRLT
jgi:hypothetical protein